MRRGVCFGSIAACLAACVGPAAAQAAMVQVVTVPTPSTQPTLEVRYTAAPGEANRLAASAAPSPGASFLPGRIDVADPVGVTPGPGCTRPDASDPTRARCSAPSNNSFNRTVITLFDGADTGRLSGPYLNALLDGGDGADTLAVSSAGPPSDSSAATFIGGQGNDVMFGGPGGDVFAEDSSANGGDIFNGGGGDDTASYEERRRGLRLSLDRRTNDGAPGEGDRINSDVETVTGGRGNDRISGNRRANFLDGRRGTDRLRGGSGADLLAAGPGRTRDRLDGGRGDDTLTGSRGANRLRGGPGQDRITGGRGNDRIDARDRSIDEISCGRGRDRLRIDRLDFFGRGCERVRRRGSPAAVALDIRLISEQGGPGSLFVEIACPRDGPRRCRGRATVRIDGRVAGRPRFNLARGESGGVDVPLGSADDVGRRASATLSSRDRRSRLRSTRRRGAVL